MINLRWRKSIYWLLPFLFILQGQASLRPFESYFIDFNGTEEKISMTPVQGGSFHMGSQKPDDAPEHLVNVSDFWMGTYEVTWEQYELFLYREIDHVSQPIGPVKYEIDAVSGATMPYVNFNKPGYPAICITQYAASQFCKWLTATTGDFYRLPTEAEWEYACRTGVPMDYSIAERSIGEYAWFQGNANQQLQVGGKKRPNSLGLYDMHGNASEWVLDSYEPGYAHLASDTNPLHLTDELYPHVVRGGSFKDDKTALRPAARGFSSPKWKRQDPQFPKSLWWHTDAIHVGFRIVRPVMVPPKEEMEKYWIKPVEEY